jgi:glycosyltransferase involved in cell wall biosynthesis
MKVLSFNAYYTPEFAASLFLEEDIAEGFAKAGLENEMYVPTPSRGVSDEVREEYKSKKEEFFFDNKLRVVRYDLMKEGKNPFLRALRYFLQNYKQYKCGTHAKDIDVIFCGSTPPTQGLMAGYVKKKLCKKYKKYVPFVYNLQDVFPDSLVGTGLAKKGGLLWKIGRKVEDKTYKNADKILVISQDFKRNLLEKGVPEEKIEVVYNWVDTNKISPIAKDENPLYEEFDISRDGFNVVYAGNLGNAQNVMLLIDAAKKLKDYARIKFIIFGSGGMEQELKNEITEHQLQNVKMLPLQPVERVPMVYSLGDVCVVACKKGLGGSAMPSKTWSIMACERAVIANFDEGELKSIIEDNECGVFTKAGDTEAFVDSIVRLCEIPSLCLNMGKNGRRFVMENLEKEICTKKYVEAIYSVFKK